MVAGLNPHAGEQGQLGTEELDWLMPLLERWRLAHPNVTLLGPMPPDTCWLSAAQAWNQTSARNSPDGLLALYHDQGLIPVKLLAFDQAVNTTLGLSFLRTSPDHGTGFDIAGLGIARPDAGRHSGGLGTQPGLTRINTDRIQRACRCPRGSPPLHHSLRTPVHSSVSSPQGCKPSDRR